MTDNPRMPHSPGESREFTVRICDQCYRLEGQMCHNPECVFCRRTMVEVGEMLDALLIRPVVDGVRLDLHPFEAGDPRETPKGGVMRFGGEFEREKAQFDNEVDAEAAKLVRDGMEPFDALNVARDTVQRRRRTAARERDQKALIGR
jgi:hypothetical protein